MKGRSSTVNVWKVHARWRDDGVEFASYCREEKVIVVGYGEKDVTGCKSKEGIRTALVKQRERKLKSATTALSRLCIDMKPGDIVLLGDSDKGRRSFDVGILRDGHGAFFNDKDPKCRWGHRRRVRWIKSRVPASEVNRIAKVKNRIGGVDAISPVRVGAAEIRSWVGHGAPVQIPKGKANSAVPDRQWGIAAENRAKRWLRGEYKEAPVDRTKDAAGWDFECVGKYFEVKGRHSADFMVRLSANEYEAATKHGRKYVLLLFTASTESALAKAIPKRYPDPARQLTWRPRKTVEYQSVEL